MNKLFSIGEVSKIKEITIKALRYYHQKGILIPSHIDKTTAYRYYSIDQFVHIDIIRACRELGTSIKELQEIFKTCDTDKLLEFLNYKKQKAEENIEKMKKIIVNIDEMNYLVDYSREQLSSQEISIKYIAERYIIGVPCKEVGNLEELIYYSNLEKIINKIAIKTIKKGGILHELDHQGNVESRYVFEEIDGDEYIEESEYIKKLAGGKYITIVYKKDNEETQINKIKNYIKDNKKTIKNYIEIDLIDDIFNTDSYSCQIQMLID